MQRQNPDITAVILAYNEEIHLQRAIESVMSIVKRVVVVDSYSTDRTTSIAEEMGAAVFLHEFVHQAQQFTWAMEHCDIQTTWILRLDADEFLTPALCREIESRLPNLDPKITGVIFKRQVHFMGQWIRFGGYYPIKLLRLWRKGKAAIEQRRMDEHTYLLEGEAITFDHDIVDDNLNDLTWWTTKHNGYSTREAIDILSIKYAVSGDGKPKVNHSGQAGSKRWYKNNLYLRLPLFFRAFLYFNFRFWIKLGFLDGRKGLIWHFLQGFWYRFLVDAKIAQIEWYARKENKSVSKVLAEKFKVKP